MLVLFRFWVDDASDTSLERLVPAPRRCKTAGHAEEFTKRIQVASATRSQLFYRALGHNNDDASFVASRHVVRVDNNVMHAKPGLRADFSACKIIVPAR